MHSVINSLILPLQGALNKKKPKPTVKCLLCRKPSMTIASSQQQRGKSNRTQVDNTFQNKGFLAFSFERLQHHMQWLGRYYSARLIGIVIINNDFFGKDPLEGVLAFPARDQVQDSNLALLKPSPTNFVRAINVNCPLDVAFVVFHERPAINDDRSLVGLVAFGHLFCQVIGIDDLDASQLLCCA